MLRPFKNRGGMEGNFHFFNAGCNDIFSWREYSTASNTEKERNFRQDAPDFIPYCFLLNFAAVDIQLFWTANA
jgi:hypothetical protein